MSKTDSCKIPLLWRGVENSKVFLTGWLKVKTLDLSKPKITTQNQKPTIQQQKLIGFKNSSYF